MGSSSYSSRCVDPWKSSAKLMTADKSSPERMNARSLNMEIARNHAQPDATRHPEFTRSCPSIDLNQEARRWRNRRLATASRADRAAAHDESDRHRPRRTLPHPIPLVPKLKFGACVPTLLFPYHRERRFGEGLAHESEGLRAAEVMIAGVRGAAFPQGRFLG